MNTITVSATHARNNFFELLDLVARGGSVVVKKDQKIVAKVVPAIPKTSGLAAFLKATKASRGILKDYSIKDNPLRRPGAASFLGQWDKKA